jgi:hypothetical protein
VYASYYPAAAVNDDVRETGASGGFWLDGTSWSWPDWVQVAWPQPVTLARLVLRGVVNRAGYPDGYRTLGQVRVQYWDAATASWMDVIGQPGQENPIVNWVLPVTTADGSEIKQFDFASVTTTKVRALIESGTTEGWSWMDEIEAYAP